jgi:hypothetical protein
MNDTRPEDPEEILAPHFAVFFAAMSFPPLLLSMVSVQVSYAIMAVTTAFSFGVFLQSVFVIRNRRGLKWAALALGLSMLWWIGIGMLILIMSRALDGM